MTLKKTGKLHKKTIAVEGAIALIIFIWPIFNTYGRYIINFFDNNYEALFAISILLILPLKYLIFRVYKYYIPILFKTEEDKNDLIREIERVSQEQGIRIIFVETLFLLILYMRFIILQNYIYIIVLILLILLIFYYIHKEKLINVFCASFVFLLILFIIIFPIVKDNIGSISIKEVKDIGNYTYIKVHSNPKSNVSFYLHSNKLKEYTRFEVLSLNRTTNEYTQNKLNNEFYKVGMCDICFSVFVTDSKFTEDTFVVVVNRSALQSGIYLLEAHNEYDKYVGEIIIVQ